MEIIERLLTVLEVDSDKPGCLTTAAVMKIVAPALEHTNGEVRDVAVRVVLDMYKKVKEPVRAYLPPDEPASRKIPLYRAVFDGMDRIDGKPTESERKAKAKAEKANAEKTKQAEIEALQAQLQALRDMAGGKGVADSATDVKGTKQKGAKKKKEEPPAVDMDRMCIFCGEQNPSFTEEMLDLHYWKSCPMLKRCDHCAQVVEISGMTEHLLTECDIQDKFAQCPKCKEAMLKVDLEEHFQGKCTGAKGGKGGNHCILCKKNIGTADEAWRQHLMEECKQNKTRLQQQQASKAPSRASLRSNRGRGGKTTPLGRGAQGTAKARKATGAPR